MNTELKAELDAMFPEAKEFVDGLRISKGDKYTGAVIFAAIVEILVKKHDDPLFAGAVGNEHLFRLLQELELIERMQEVLTDADTLKQKGLNDE